MKRIFLLLTVVAMTALTGCSNDDDRVDNDTIAEVYEIRDVDFTNDGAGNYGIISNLNPQIFTSDMVLVYRRAGSDGGNPIWESLPKTIYFEGGSELDYNFDFTTNDVSIYLGYTDASALSPAFITNQLFRVVIIPGYLSNKSASASSVDLSDYNAVVRAYGIDDTKIGVLSPSVK